MTSSTSLKSSTYTTSSTYMASSDLMASMTFEMACRPAWFHAATAVACGMQNKILPFLLLVYKPSSTGAATCSWPNLG